MFCALCGKVYNDPYITSCGVSVGSQNSITKLPRVSCMFTEYCIRICNAKLVYVHCGDIITFHCVKEEIVYAHTDVYVFSKAS